MKKIYVVSRLGTLDNQTIVKSFTTAKKAREYAINRDGNYEIVEVELENE